MRRVLPLLGLFLAICGCIDRNERLPIVIIDTQSTVQGGAVEVGITLRDVNTNGLRVGINYGEPGTLTERRATLLPGSADTNNLAASPGGIRHVFLWDALGDIGAGRFPAVVLSFDLDNGTRAAAVFDIRNVDLFASVGPLSGHREQHAGSELRDGRVLISGGRDAQGTLLASSELFAIEADTFALSDTLAEARANHTQTTLLDGRILVVGGEGSGGALASAELYDPVTGTFSATGALATARQRHQATLLEDGRVLISGGVGVGGGALASAELYDPGTDSFSPAGNHVAREGHRATLLADGNVLLSGGRAAGSLVASAELFVPGTGFVTVSDAPERLRREHSATRLEDGRVLITGGLGSSDSTLAAVEVFVPDTSQPAAGSFESLLDSQGQTVTLLQARARHAAALTADSAVVIFGGSDGVSQLAAAEVFEPAAGDFRPTRDDLRNPRARPVAVSLSSRRVLITGDDASAVMYHPPVQGDDESFDVQPGGHRPRTGAVATAFSSGEILVTGGRDRDGVSTVAERFIVTEQRFEEAGSMQVARVGHSAIGLVDGRVLIVGGSDGSNALASVELYDPDSNAFTLVAAPTARIAPELVRLDDQTVLIIGGSDGSNALASVDQFDPTTLTFTSAASMSQAREGFSAHLMTTGDVVAIGGENAGGRLRSAELYRPGDNTWRPTAESLEVARTGFAAVFRPPNRVMVIGGVSDTGAISLVEQYDAGLDTFARVDFDVVARDRPEAFLLTFGDIVIFGGSGEAARRGSIWENFNNEIRATRDPFLDVPRLGSGAASISFNSVLIYGGETLDGRLIGGSESFTQQDFFR